MVKKLTLALGMTAVTGIVTALTSAGCTSNDGASSSGGTTNAPEGGADRTIPEEPDGGGELRCPKSVSLSAADLDGEIGWKKAAPSPGACSQGDLTQLETNFKDGTIASYFDLGKSLSDACKSCVFSKDTDATWGPIVGSADDNGMTGFLNFGACFGAVEGDACGKALQYEQFCYNVACNECATTSAERQTCIEAAGTDGMCKTFGETTATACPNIQSSAKACNTIADAVKSLCGAGVGDGGPD